MTIKTPANQHESTHMSHDFGYGKVSQTGRRREKSGARRARRVSRISFQRRQPPRNAAPTGTAERVNPKRLKRP